MNEEIARGRNAEPLDLGRNFTINLFNLSHNRAGFTIEQFITALQVTRTLKRLSVDFAAYAPWPENNRRFIEPLCRCIANLRRYNQNHPLRTLQIGGAVKGHDVDQLLLAAKHFGIHHLAILGTRLPVESLVAFCHSNSHLKELEINITSFSVEETTISQDALQNPSFILALDKLAMTEATFQNSSVATKLLNFMAHVTYPALELGDVIVCGNVPQKQQESKILLELIKPSVQHLTLDFGCPIEVMDVIEACATVTQIQLDDNNPPVDFRPAEVQEKLQAIAMRNGQLARFVANPRAYPVEELLVLMTQFDKSPTGRFMLARSFPGIPSFFNSNEITDASTAGTKKRKCRY